MAGSQDLYSVLGIDKTAAPEDIKKAFKRLAIENHPDKNAGCKDKEEIFKEINSAYSVLSDPQKKTMYDQFGTIDGAPGGGGQPDLNDILKNMFGGMGGGMPGMGGGGQMPGGFSFVFMDGQGGGGMPGGMPEDIFAQMFGGRKQQQQHQSKQDIVDVTVDICDIYYGNNKRVEFELLELCNGCQGTGASDPSQIIKCMTCKGNGEVMQQIGPFVNKMKCPSCGGNGSAIKRACTGCKGQKTIYNKKAFDLKLPKGIPHNHEVRMTGRGSYNPQTKQNKDMVFKFKHNIETPYSLDSSMNVIMNLSITIEELVGGFVKPVKMYKDDMVLTSDRYFNPLNPIVLKGKGIIDMRTNETTDMLLKFHVEFIESDKLVKYKDVFHKMFKKFQDLGGHHVVDIHGSEEK